MDYKKLIIINLAFLIIYGKLLQFLFIKLQRNLLFINIDKNEKLKNIFTQYNKNKSLNPEKVDQINLNEKEIKNDYKNEHYTYEELVNFQKNLQIILNKNLTLNEIKEIEDIVNKIEKINNFCEKIKKFKLKIFLFSILLIIIANFIVTRKCISWDNINKIKEKMRDILRKIKTVQKEPLEESTNNQNISEIIKSNNLQDKKNN